MSKIFSKTSKVREQVYIQVEITNASDNARRLSITGDGTGYREVVALSHGAFFGLPEAKMFAS